MAYVIIAVLIVKANQPWQILSTQTMSIYNKCTQGQFSGLGA